MWCFPVEHRCLFLATRFFPLNHLSTLTSICIIGMELRLSSITLKLVGSPEMEQYTFEAILFLAILANYHKSDAAKLNPYLKRIRETTDTDFMNKLCWASNFALGTSIKFVLPYFLLRDDIDVSSELISLSRMMLWPPHCPLVL
jgi:hypothetical protein